MQDVLRYSVATLGSKVCWSVYQQADAFVLGKVSGDVALGFFSMAKQLATLPVDKVSGVVNLLASPLMAELQANSEALRRAFMRSLRLIACISFPLCIGLMIEAEDLVLVALTDKWMSAVPVLQVLCSYAIFSSVSVLFAPILMARYRAGLLLRYTLIQLLWMPFAFWLGAALWGAVGVAIAWSTAYPLALTWLAREALREMDLDWHTFFDQFRPAVIATVAMALTLIVVQWGWVRWGVDIVSLRLTVSVLLGTTVYGAVLLWIGGPIRNEVKEVLGWVFQMGKAIAAVK